MKTLIPVLLFVAISAAAADDFSGHYELVGRAKKAFALDVKQKGRTAEISFSAGHEDGSGAAPDGDGKGRLNATRELEFTFTDSFENTGTGTLRRAAGGYRLTMKMTKVVEPRAVVHYGDLALKRK